MRRAVKLFEALVAIAIVLAAGLFVGSEWIVGRGHAVPDDRVAIPRDPAAIAEGGRLARLAGCRGCHGPNGEGRVWTSDRLTGTIAPPALARKLAGYSDAELVRLIRYGVKRDGSTLFRMPSRALGSWADDDLGRIIAWLRTLKPGAGDSRVETSYGPLPRLGMLTGSFEESVRHVRLAPAHRPPETGRYVYDTACAACHRLGDDHAPGDGPAAPALAPRAAGQDPAAFHRLLRAGMGRHGRDRGPISAVARDAVHALGDMEIAALHAYLRGEAARLGR